MGYFAGGYGPGHRLRGWGDDLIDTVSDPPSRDVVRCGPGRDEVQADPEDDVGEDCEAVQIIDLTKGEEPPKGTPKYMPKSE